MKIDVDENFIDESKQEHKIELEKIEEQKVEYFESAKKRNLIPFIVFPLTGNWFIVSSVLVFGIL